MKNLILFSVLLLFVLNNGLKAQTPFGEIRGKVTDAKTKKPIDFATVTAYLNGIAKASTQSDDDGNYTIKSLATGTYSIKAYMTGYPLLTINEISVLLGSVATVNIKLEQYVSLKEVCIRSTPPLIRKDGVSGAQYNSSKMMAIPQRNINSISSISPGVDSRSSSTPDIRGGRSENTAYYIDGIRVQATENSNESYKHVAQNNFKSVNHEPLSTFSVDVDRASYSNIRRYLTEGYLPPADAVRIEEMINYFDYDYEKKSSDMPFMVYTDLVDCPWKEKNKIVQITLQAPKISMEKSVPSNLVFLIDVSGSMQSSDKLPLVQAGLKLLVRQMREEDKIAMVVYAGSVGLVLDATSGKDKEKIISAIDNLMAGGSTAGGAGIEMAYKVAKDNFIKNGNNRVILATDGDFNVGVTENGELEKFISEKKETGIFLTVLGFGTGNIQDDRMEMLADKGNGNYAYIDNINEANKVLVKEMGGTLYAVAKDVKLQVEFNPVKVKSYKLIGYENRLLANEDFNNDKKDAGEIGAGHTVTALYEIELKKDKDDEDKSIDKLKYQTINDSAGLKNQNEILTVKVRYKKPDENESKKSSYVLYDKSSDIDTANNNIRFAMSVAMFGMKLREDKEAKEISATDIINLAKHAKGKDEEGYRAEFIKMVETYSLIAKR